MLSGVEYAYCNAYLRICLSALNEKTHQLYDYWYCSRTFHVNSDGSRVASYVKSRKSMSKRISASDNTGIYSPSICAKVAEDMIVQLNLL